MNHCRAARMGGCSELLTKRTAVTDSEHLAAGTGSLGARGRLLTVLLLNSTASLKLIGQALPGGAGARRKCRQARPAAKVWRGRLAPPGTAAAEVATWLAAIHSAGAATRTLPVLVPPALRPWLTWA
jgi:hypothetical protein